MAKDRVCGKDIMEFPDSVKSEFENEIYYFCSAECRDKFIQDPYMFLQYKTSSDQLIKITNISKTNRDIRLIIGATCMALFLKTEGLLKAVFAVLGLYFTITSIAGFCPISKLIKIINN
jgi:YHS domain-containing protein